MFVSWSERFNFVFGVFLLVVTLPITGIVVLPTLLWDFLDRGCRGKPLTGLTFQLARYVNKITHAFNLQFVKHPEDTFMVNAAWLLGGLIPLLFAINFAYTLAYGFCWQMWLAYHILRIGPYFMNFAYVYTLCHKEGHAKDGLFVGTFNTLFGNIFNWWVGVFYGVMPSSFTYGHSINHHKYNNGPNDVVSSADKPRDNFLLFVAYVPRFFFYAINVSTVVQFCSEGLYFVAAKMVLGSLYWASFVCFFAYFSPFFALSYLLYPTFEQAVLLSGINWVWHGFIDPKDPENPYVQAVTIHEGLTNVLEEDYHVVHHQYPGVHWAKNPERFAKHFNKGEYTKNFATAFRGTHVYEIFFLMLFRQYGILADKWVDYSETLTKPQIEEMIKTRLRACWWGPRAPKDLKLKGSEIGNFDMNGTGNEEETGVVPVPVIHALAAKKAQ